MSRTVVITEIKKPTRKEAKTIEAMNLPELFKAYKEFFSISEIEMNYSQKYIEVKPYLRKVKTTDGYTFYVGKNRTLSLSSDPTIASYVHARVPNYKRATYKEITKLAGRVIFRGENKLFIFPRKKKRVHLFFFDDMD